jgi:hypothetical protein
LGNKGYKCPFDPLSKIHKLNLFLYSDPTGEAGPDC